VQTGGGVGSSLCTAGAPIGRFLDIIAGGFVSFLRLVAIGTACFELLILLDRAPWRELNSGKSHGSQAATRPRN
jgi:hypothetical protein